MTEPQPILFERDGPVARLTLNRPEKRNAFDDALLDAIQSALAAVENDAAIRVLLLSGTGAHFCAGADLNWMRRAGTLDEAANRADALAFARMLARLDRLPVPTIALVRGSVFGGGIGLVTACDIAVCDDTARFCLSEVRLGLVPAVIAPYVVRAVGERWTRRLMLTAELLPADDARAVGLVHEVADDPEARVATLIDGLLGGAPGAQATVKTLVRRCAAPVIDDSLIAFSADLIARLRGSDEGREGIAAFFDKRKPAWAQSGSWTKR